MENQAQVSEESLLVMYDVRGIQDYIFRTNKIVEVMGASHIIEEMIPKALRAAVQAAKLEQGEAITGWPQNEWRLDSKKLRFFSDSNIKVQLLYEGGGNAFALFRNSEVSQEINRLMARYVLETSYSLQLAVAEVGVSGDFSDDFSNLTRKMSQMKNSSPVSHMTGALPIMQTEEGTGFPAVGIESHLGKTVELSYETQKKRERYGKEKEGAEKELENLVTEKGVDSSIAVVHIDGNNMGNRIRQLMQEEKDYTKAIAKIRSISFNINKSFKDVFDDMRTEISRRAAEHPAFKNKKKPIFIRSLLQAGDDITFICNAKIALSAVQYFAREIDKKRLYSDKKTKGSRIYGFSVCAGIAYAHSHFPFRVAYEVAEKCCKRAKERAKEEKHLVCINDQISRSGSWVDFQICKSAHVMNLSGFRRQEYQLFDGTQLLLRPYHLSLNDDKKMKELCEAYDFSIFDGVYRHFSGEVNGGKDSKKIARSFVQDLKTAYTQGKHEMDAAQTFAKSRNIPMPDQYPNPFEEKEGREYAIWYDVLEQWDYYVNLLEGSYGV